MKKIELIPFVQKEMTFYLLSYDPRQIIKLVDFPNSGTVQNTQRPWDESRVKDISHYVAGLNNLDLSKLKEKTKRKAKGIIPNCPILNIHGKLKIVKENGRFFMLFPENEKEFDECKGAIEILDGQHRLISFSEKMIDVNFKNSEVYQMGYVICDDLTQDEKTEIFIFSNEKQKTVDKNVLRQLMKWLKLLSNEDESLYDFVVKFNTDTHSPLRGRISIGGARVKNGFKILQVIKILDKSKTISTLTNGKPLNSDTHFKSLSAYLKAWETIYPGKFNHPAHTLGKISGLRYVFFLFPYISNILKHQQKKTSVESVALILETLKNTILNENFFKSVETNPDLLAFRGESSTISLAEKHGRHLEELLIGDSKEFDPNN